jgi:hypothetical protein
VDLQDRLSHQGLKPSDAGSTWAAIGGIAPALRGGAMSDVPQAPRIARRLSENGVDRERSRAHGRAQAPKSGDSYSSAPGIPAWLRLRSWGTGVNR